MQRKLALLAGSALAAALAFLLGRRRARPEAAAPEFPQGDPRAEELRRRLAEAREAAASEDEFEAAGMGAETAVDVEPPRDEFEAMRRRVHDEARAAAEEMRRGAQADEPD